VTEIVTCSIIIPVLNEADYLPIQLKRLQKWRDAGHEVIVVDGGSNDGSVEMAKPLVDRFITAQKGRAVQMNKGAELANNGWLVFLHVDTLFSEAALNALQIAFHNKEVKWGRFDVRLSGNGLLLGLVSSFMNIRSRLTGIATGDQAIFVRKSVFDQVNGFPDIVLMEDIDLSSQLKKISPPYCIADKVTTSSRRWREQGVVKTILMMWSLRLRYFFGVSPTVLAKHYNRASK